MPYLKCFKEVYSEYLLKGLCRAAGQTNTSHSAGAAAHPALCTAPSRRHPEVLPEAIKRILN